MQPNTKQVNTPAIVSNPATVTWENIDSLDVQEGPINLPGFTNFQNPSLNILALLQNATTGSAAYKCLEHFTIGQFDIDCSLISPHPNQREVDNLFVTELAHRFASQNIHRHANVGLLLGLGAGWNNLCHHKPEPVRITSQFSSLDSLRGEGDESIGQILWGQHRALAAVEYATTMSLPEEGYWTFKVLSPGKKCSKNWKIMIQHF
jgi:hypothetical protein